MWMTDRHPYDNTPLDDRGHRGGKKKNVSIVMVFYKCIGYSFYCNQVSINIASQFVGVFGTYGALCTRIIFIV